MLKSRLLPVVLAFIILVCGTGYILSPKGDQAFQKGFQHAMAYLPTYGIALIIAIVAGYSIGLIAGKKNKDNAVSYGSLIIFLVISGLSIFKDHLTMQNGQDLLSKGQMQVSKWLGHPSVSSKDTAPPATNSQHQAPPQKKPNGQPNESKSQLQRWASNIQRQLPQSTDKYTQLTRISYSSNNNTVSMRYDVDGFDSLGVDEDEFTQAMQGNMTKLYCHGVFFRPILTSKANVYATYHYNHGGVIGSPITLKPTLCK